MPKSYINNSFKRLDKHEKATLIIKVPSDIHFHIKTYAQHSNRSMNAIVTAVLQEFVEAIPQHIKKVPIKLGEPVSTEVEVIAPLPHSQTLLERFKAFSSSRILNEQRPPEEFGLSLKLGHVGTSVTDYTLYSFVADPLVPSSVAQTAVSTVDASLPEPDADGI